MPWQQHRIDVTWFDGHVSVGAATRAGNNAAWHCRCGMILVSASSEPFGRGQAQLTCPDCGFNWVIDSDGGTNQVPTGVRQV